jgi:hypothetical protein
MKCAAVVLAAVGLVGLGESALFAQPRGPRRGGEEAGGKFGWLSSLEQGKAQARKSGKPIMVVLRCQP